MNMRDFLVLIILTIFCGTVYGGLPLVINNWPFKNATLEAWSVLKETGNPLHALVEGCSRCEREQCDFAVGYGGNPDESGETSLDAMIMDGSNLNVGAVANLREIKYAIKVAKHVLLNTRHSIIAGNQATEFAVKMGFVRESLKTNYSRQLYDDWVRKNCQPNYWTNVVPDPRRFCGPYKAVDTLDSSSMDYAQYDFGPGNHDTVGMIVIDEERKIFAASTTNGVASKIPGRVGDASVPGGGVYSNNRYGAAVCTGYGDVMMRHLPSFLAVELLRSGLSPREAADEVIRRIMEYDSQFDGAIIVVDTNGNYAVACNQFRNGYFTYSVANELGVRLENATCVT